MPDDLRPLWRNIARFSDRSIADLHDRADVIVPAAIILKAIVDRAGIDEIQIPQVGLKEGVLLDLAMRVIDAQLPADGEI